MPNSNKTRLSDASLTAFHEAHRKMSRALAHFDYHVDAILNDARLSKHSARFLANTWYANHRKEALTLAHRPVRAALSDALALVLLKHCEATPEASRGSRRLRLLSTCPNAGYGDYAAGKLEFAKVKKHVQASMQRRSLEGLAITDFALVDPACNGCPDELGIHFHAICQPSLETAQRTPIGNAKLRSKKRNKHGLAVVQQNVRADPLTTCDVADLSYYVSKLSAGLKGETRDVTRGSQKLWRHEHALRALELCSYLSLEDGLVAVGNLGQDLREQCLARLSGSLSYARDDEAPAMIDHAATRRKWRRLYRELELLDELRPLRVECGS